MMRAVSKITLVLNNKTPLVGLKVKWLIALIGVPIGLWGGVVFGEYCWQYVDSFLANNPKNWACSNAPPSGIAPADLGAQRIIDEHFNWHCANGHIGAAAHSHPDPDFPSHFGQPTYGRSFLAEHKQFISDFDLWRDTVSSLGRIETWNPNNVTNTAASNYNPMPWGIPGSGVSAANAGAIAGGTCLVGTGRSGDGVNPATFTVCQFCTALYSQFRLPPFGTLGVSGQPGDFATADDLGSALDSGWHGSFHGGIASATDSGGNSCNDINPPRTSPRDPMFWRAHKALDDVHGVWQTLQASDIMIVFDRSGSMTQPSEAGSSVTKLNAAKSAAAMFAGMVDDTGGHKVGLVSFASTATSPVDLGLTPAAGILPTMQTALNAITAFGGTSIGDGLIQAQVELITPGSNERNAILLLTDGKENTPPCLDGSGPGCSGTGGISPVVFNDTQICAIGYGADDSTLDGKLLRDLTEQQGGIYISGAGELQLKKFFLDCFADIFDEFIAVDPEGVLAAGETASPPMIVSSGFDSKMTFVLAWENRGDPLSLEITTPSGVIVDTADPTIESSEGATWAFVRVPLPYKGDSMGNWQARAIRLDPPGKDNPYFLSALVSGPARVEATNLRFFHYTDEPLFPTARIKSPYTPEDGFDKVVAKVIITRPIAGSGNILMKTGLGQAATINGDSVDARTAQLLELANGAVLIPTVTETYQLFDDGTNGDRFAGNEYWSTQLPNLALVEGEYRYRFVFTITEKGKTFQREAVHSVNVEVKLDPEATKPEIEKLGTGIDGRERTRFKITPVDKLGNFFGPGRPDAFEFVLTGDAVLEMDPKTDETVMDDGFGGYEVIASWTEKLGEPTLSLRQNGKVRQTLVLPTLQLILGMPAVASHFDEEIVDRPKLVPPVVQREVSNLSPVPGEVVTINLLPSNFDAYSFTAAENIGGLDYAGVHTADENPGGTTFVMLKPFEFTYEVQVPSDAIPGTKFVLNGEFWDNPDFKEPIGEDTIVVAGTLPGPNLVVPDLIPVITGLDVTVPVNFASNGNDIASLAFSLDFDETNLGFDPTDANSDGIPDSVNFLTPGAFTEGVLVDLADTNGELDFVIFANSVPLSALSDGPLVEITFSAFGDPGAGNSLIAPVVFSQDLVPTFGDTNSQNVPGSTEDGSVLIKGVLYGDCNGDGVVSSADLTAEVLEIFDGDGTVPTDAHMGSFSGTVGCDSNEDGSIGAADITCVVLIIFGGPGACTNGAQIAVAGSDGQLAGQSGLLASLRIAVMRGLNWIEGS